MVNEKKYDDLCRKHIKLQKYESVTYICYKIRGL